MDTWVKILTSAAIPAIPTLGLWWLTRKGREDLLRNQISQHKLTLDEWTKYLGIQRGTHDKNIFVALLMQGKYEIDNSKEYTPVYIKNILEEYTENTTVVNRSINASISKEYDGFRMQLCEINRWVNYTLRSLDSAIFSLDSGEDIGDRKSILKELGNGLLKHCATFEAECIGFELIISEHIENWKKYERRNDVRDLMQLGLRGLQKYRKSLINYKVDRDKYKQKIQEKIKEHHDKRISIANQFTY